MVLVPAGSTEVAKLAWPPVVVPVPKIVVPFLNVTVSPFGMEPVLGVTVAVKVTGSPT